MIRPVVRIAAVVLGLAAVVYGVASLTGGWLGTPPWWERAAPMSPSAWVHRHRPQIVPRFDASGLHSVFYREAVKRARSRAALHVEPRQGREWISVGVVGAGFALAAFGSWPRRRPEVAA